MANNDPLGPPAPGPVHTVALPPAAPARATGPLSESAACHLGTDQAEFTCLAPEAEQPAQQVDFPAIPPHISRLLASGQTALNDGQVALSNADAVVRQLHRARGVFSAMRTVPERREACLTAQRTNMAAIRQLQRHLEQETDPALRAALETQIGKLQDQNARLMSATAILSTAYLMTDSPVRHMPSGRRELPDFPRFDAASDADATDRNEVITARYGQLNAAFDEWFGGPDGCSWLAMAVSASAEVGRAMGLLDIGEELDSDYEALLPALAEGNREIYNTVAPAFQIFLEAELNGGDGVEALIASDHFLIRLRGDRAHTTYAQTGKLIEGFQTFQEARRATDPKTRDRLVHEANKCFADYEQRQVLEPIVSRPAVHRAMGLRSVSGNMRWTDATGERRRVLGNGGNYADLSTRLPAIAEVSRRTIELARLRVADPAQFRRQQLDAQANYEPYITH